MARPVKFVKIIFVNEPEGRFTHLPIWQPYSVQSLKEKVSHDRVGQLSDLGRVDTS